jgi:hypothetical protein
MISYLDWANPVVLGERNVKLTKGLSMWLSDGVGGNSQRILMRVAFENNVQMEHQEAYFKTTLRQILDR